jgi:hypothetical protein
MSLTHIYPVCLSIAFAKNTNVTDINNLGLHLFHFYFKISKFNHSLFEHYRIFLSYKCKLIACSIKTEMI